MMSEEVIVISSEGDDEEDDERPRKPVKRRRKRLKLTLKKAPRCATSWEPVDEIESATSVETDPEPEDARVFAVDSDIEWIESKSSTDSDIVEIDQEAYLPCREHFLETFYSADEETENSDVEESTEAPIARMIIENPEIVKYERPTFPKENHKEYRRALYAIQGVDASYLRFRAVNSTMTQSGKDEEWDLPNLAEKHVIRQLYGLIHRQGIEPNLKKKLLQRTFMIKRPPMPAQRTLLARNVGTERINIYLDVDHDEETRQEEIAKLAQLTYINKSIKTFENKADLLIKPTGRKYEISCNCRSVDPGTRCSCIKNKNCICWTSSSPGLRGLRGGVTFEEVDWDKSIIFVCGKKCACRGLCTNQLSLSRSRFRVDLVKKDVNMGYEIFAAEPIPPRHVIMPFLGEIINQDQFDKRARDEDHPTAEYSFQLYDENERNGELFKSKKVRAPEPNTSLFIDPSRKGNIGRFLAHSCLPNTIPIRILRNSRRIEDAVMALIANEPIPVGYPITFDYGEKYVKQRLKDLCLCNSPNCCAEKTGKEYLSPEEICFEYLGRLKHLIQDMKADAKYIGFLKSEMIIQNEVSVKLRKEYDQKVDEKAQKKAGQNKSKNVKPRCKALTRLKNAHVKRARPSSSP